MAEQKKQSYDVIVVGSGASGGWACKRLAEAGLKVALLEAGRPQSDKNFTEHQPAFELKYRNRAPEIVRKTRPIQVKFGVCNEYTYNWFVHALRDALSPGGPPPHGGRPHQRLGPRQPAFQRLGFQVSFLRRLRGRLAA